EFLLFATDRAQHFDQIIIPHLKANKLIISDRMADSSLVYQGYGRGLDKNMIETINTWAMQGNKPDLTLYVKVTPEIAAARIIARKTALSSFEKEKQAFMQTLVNGFETLYKKRTDVIIVDGTQTEQDVTRQALTGIIAWITQQNLIT